MRAASNQSECPKGAMKRHKPPSHVLCINRTPSIERGFGHGVTQHILQYYSCLDQWMGYRHFRTDNMTISSCLNMMIKHIG